MIATAKIADGEVVPYVPNYRNQQPKFVTILFPGGSGQMNPHMNNGKVAYDFGGNFLIRSRKDIIDCEAYAHHGYRGIERETMDAIKQWIRRGH